MLPRWSSDMASSRKKVKYPDAPVKKTKTVATRAKRADPPAPLWVLLPSAEQLQQIVARPTSAQSSGGDRAASLDIPPALLNPLESLPRPLSLDEVKERLRATGPTRSKQA
jgi:hypothetical protein